MQSLKRWLIFLVAGIVGLGIMLLISSFIASDYLVDLWWFQSLNYEFYFWQRLLYRYAIFGGVTAVFFLIFWLNFWAASRYLGTSPAVSTLNPTSLQAYKDLFQLFRTGSMWVYTPLSIILAVPIALPLFRQWEAFLLYLFAPGTGITDPVYGKDISYYLFSYPIYTLLQRRLLLALLLLLVGVLVLYILERRLLSQQDQRLPAGAKVHLNILVLLIFFVEFWHYILERYALLYSEHHEPLFYGPGYTEMMVILPLIWLTLILLAGIAFSFMTVIHRRNRQTILVFSLFVVCFALSFGARYSDFLPNLMQQYVVKPNAISKEKPYIQNSIEATLSAYNLKNVEIRDFSPERIPVDITAPRTQNILRNIPVWDGDLLNSVYEQLQELRTYYDFSKVDVSHYHVNGRNQQVFLAARELNTEEIPQGARNWVNEHLTYTHGYGAVMTPAAQGGDESMTWFMRGIPIESDFGFKLDQPAIYYGHLSRYPFIIAPNDAGEFDYPQGNSNALSNYEGKGGVPVSSLFRKLLFAYYFNDTNIFLTTKTNENSKMLFRRNIQERVRTLTPYFTLDRDPYLVVTPKRMYWIQDAYTTSNRYPNAQTFALDSGPINYVRNSVKIVIDAYDGTVDYYIIDTKDPIIQAYSLMYPGFFKSLDQFPREIIQQIRYPQDLFDVQMTIYSKYHQTDPEVFYQQEDLWDFAPTSRGKGSVETKSYYLTLDLIEQGTSHFLLLAPMSPKGRSNLRALALVGSEHPFYGKLIVYNFPKGELVYGPSQVYALINQDTKVSEQFTMWDQVGSQVERGNMIILPIGKVIVYIQPVYLKSSTQLKIPELKRLIMTQGQIVVMEPTLEEAYSKLESRIKEEIGRFDKRYTTPETRPQAAPPSAPPAQSSPVQQVPSVQPTPERSVSSPPPTPPSPASIPSAGANLSAPGQSPVSPSPSMPADPKMPEAGPQGEPKTPEELTIPGTVPPMTELPSSTKE